MGVWQKPLLQMFHQETEWIFCSFPPTEYISSESGADTLLFIRVNTQVSQREKNVIASACSDIKIMKKIQQPLM